MRLVPGERVLRSLHVGNRRSCHVDWALAFEVERYQSEQSANRRELLDWNAVNQIPTGADFCLA